MREKQIDAMFHISKTSGCQTFASGELDIHFPFDSYPPTLVAIECAGYPPWNQYTNTNSTNTPNSTNIGTNKWPQSYPFGTKIAVCKGSAQGQGRWGEEAHAWQGRR